MGNMLIYVNVLCIAISGFFTAWSDTAFTKIVNFLACVINIAVVMHHIATKTIQ